MQQVLRKVAGWAIELGELVYQLRLVVARVPTPQQPQLVIGVPAAAAQRLAEELIVTRNPVADRGDRRQETGDRRQRTGLICNLLVSPSPCLRVLLKDGADLL